MNADTRRKYQRRHNTCVGDEQLVVDAAPMRRNGSSAKHGKVRRLNYGDESVIMRDLNDVADVTQRKYTRSNQGDANASIVPRSRRNWPGRKLASRPPV